MSGGAGAAAAADKAGEGVFILKHMHNLSDEVLCDRLVENPYFQTERAVSKRCAWGMSE
jgi:hypothetical protein